MARSEAGIYWHFGSPQGYHCTILTEVKRHEGCPILGFQRVGLGSSWGLLRFPTLKRKAYYGAFWAQSFDSTDILAAEPRAMRIVQIRYGSRKEVVGAKGFEPSTSWSRTRRASQAALRPDNAREVGSRTEPKDNTGKLARPESRSTAVPCLQDCRGEDRAKRALVDAGGLGESGSELPHTIGRVRAFRSARRNSAA
jgi:hypothetical protein